MSLQVVRILHTEQSKFQDVLVFESATYGNVLVLDGVIQCTERDEFSYQEMIAHLPLASHPDPKRVLVIGGGDGGVLREVVKHDSVVEAVLCDIDEAVPRVSKKYLPKMATGLTHPKSKVIIGDGFAFLKNAENKAAFDVIITDSSDPVGPAQALFEKPYFQLLKEALKPGGHISTQAECTWLHLPLIRELRKSTKELFPVADYAFTTIPTYPCGQIGFVICSLDPDRNVREAVRKVPDCKYYNDKVHKAAFVLPEFARKVIEDGAPAPGPVIATGDGEGPGKRQAKKILLLGSGYVARPFAEYVLRYPEYELTVASAHLENAQRMSVALPRTIAVSIDVNDNAALGEIISKHDVVISLIPYTYHAAVIKAACQYKTDVVTTSYVSDAIRELAPEIKKAGITVMNEIGLDPGIDHLYAIKDIEHIHAEGGKVKAFLSYCGGLPAPEAADNPLGYKFSWSSRGVLLALRNTAKFFENGKELTVSGTELMASAQPFYVSPAFAFVAYPNRDSTPFKQFYQIPEAETVIRGTLRYQGFPEFVLALVKCGFLDEEAKPYLTEKSGISWAQVTANTSGAQSTSEEALIEAVRAKCSFKSEEEARVVLQGFKWLDLFDSKKPATIRGTAAQAKEGKGNLLDTLCATLEQKCRYEQGERDMVLLRSEITYVDKAGAERTLTATLLDFGVPGGHSSMAKLVGVPCAIATKLILEGHPALKRQGEIVVPYSEEICKPIRAELEKEGITMVAKYK
jgi:spermidine synthase / saccharopine dehydrogenase (NADP+, L-glutamate-forming)